MGTEEFWVPAVISAIGATGAAVNQHQANTRADQSQAQAIADQSALQQKANAQVGQVINKIQTSSPNQIASTATGAYISQLRNNAAGSAAGGTSSALAPTPGGSKRFQADTTAAQTGVNNFGDTYAGQMGEIDAATRQRQNEALAMQSLGTQLNTLGAQSYGTNFVDQLRASTAGTPNPWGALASNLVSGFGRNSGGLFAPNKIPLDSGDGPG